MGAGESRRISPGPPKWRPWRWALPLQSLPAGVQLPPVSCVRPQADSVPVRADRCWNAQAYPGTRSSPVSERLAGADG